MTGTAFSLKLLYRTNIACILRVRADDIAERLHGIAGVNHAIHVFVAIPFCRSNIVLLLRYRISLKWSTRRLQV
jgi:hypothetical protein